MLGGVIILGTVAILALAAEILTRLTAPRYAEPSTTYEIQPWPRLEPEVERLRRKGAL